MQQKKRQQHRYTLNQKELSQSGVAKLALEYNGDLKDEVSSLKESLKIQQDAFDGLRTKNHETEKEFGILKDKVKWNIIPELLKILASAGVGYFTNRVSSENSNSHDWVWFWLFLICILVISLIQYFRNK